MNTFALAHDLFVLTVVGVWIGAALWVYEDARRRFADARRPARLLYGALALPGALPLVYACLRPAEPLAERRERELSRRLLEEALAPPERCLSCRTPLQPEFLRCPGCGDGVRQPCPRCRAPLRLHWSACPHCAHELAPTPLRLVA